MKKLMQPVLSVLVGLVIGMIFVKIVGESPWNVFKVLVNGAFGTRYDFGLTLFYAVSLVFTGLAVAIPFHAGLFNIGAEGQLVMGALAAAAVGAVFPNVSWPLAPLLASAAAFSGGALWGAIPGWLRAKRGSHEVVNTIMLNFIAAGLASWITLYLLKDPDSQNPETRVVGAGYLIHQFTFFGDAPVSSAVFLALLAVVFASVFLWKTAIGYEIRAVGQSARAAKTAGIDSARIYVISMLLGGGMAGLVGVGEVLGNAGRFRLGFSPDFGFMGIAVALVGRNRPWGIIPAALLFAALHTGSQYLDIETDHVTRDLSLILQALIILPVCAEWVWKRRRVLA